MKATKAHKKKNKKSTSASATTTTTEGRDARFARVDWDPKFKQINRNKAKVTVDKRFEKLFDKNSQFNKHVAVDKRGGMVRSAPKDHLAKLYQPEEDDVEDVEEKPVDKFAIDYSRGEALMSSSDDDSDVDEPDVDVWDKFEESDESSGDEDSAQYGDATKRLAVCNLDWDKITALDILVLCNSFKTPTGIVQRVTVYPSEFGLKRMAEEDLQGPGRIIDTESVAKDLVDYHDDTEKHEDVKLRAYQMSRLKYYYAIVECDSEETASSIYDQCDGLEYEKSSTIINMSFVPDDVTFDTDPRDMADKMPAAGEYNPPEFTTKALQHSKVSLTWDDQDPDRMKAVSKQFTSRDLKKMDFENLVASASSSEESEGSGDDDEEKDGDEDDKPAAISYAELVQQLKDKRDAQKPKVDMEITWDVGLENAASDLVKKHKEKKQVKDLTIGERYKLEKKAKQKKMKRERKEAAKNEDAALSDSDEEIDRSDPFFQEDFGPEFAAPKTNSKPKQQNGTKKKKKKGGKSDTKEDGELKLLVNDEVDGHFNFSKIVKEQKKKKSKRKRKGKPETQDDFEISTTDQRFEALFKGGAEYAPDPNHPSYMPTKGMEKIMKERTTIRHKSKKHKSSTGKPKVNGERSVDSTIANLKMKAKNRANR